MNIWGVVSLSFYDSPLLLFHPSFCLSVSPPLNNLKVYSNFPLLYTLPFTSCCKSFCLPFSFPSFFHPSLSPPLQPQSSSPLPSHLYTTFLFMLSVLSASLCLFSSLFHPSFCVTVSKCSLPSLTVPSLTWSLFPLPMLLFT